MTGNVSKLTLTNDLNIPIRAVFRGGDFTGAGEVANDPNLIPPGENNSRAIEFPNADGASCLVTTWTGAILGAVPVTAGERTITASSIDTARPYELPDPTEYEYEREKEEKRVFWLPPRPPAYNVGLGIMETNKGLFIILREQQWCPTSDGLSVAPGEEITHYTSIQSGRHESSSSQEQLTENVSSSASAGYGPFMASVSASLSKNSSYSHSVSTDVTKTSSQTITYKNPIPSDGSIPPTIVIIRWQLVDRINFFLVDTSRVNWGTEPVSSLINRELPIVSQAYELKGKYIQRPNPRVE